MIDILLIVVCGISSFVGSWFATKKYHKRNWTLDFDEKNSELNITSSKGKKVEFIESIDAQGEEDLELELKDSKLKNFLDSFKI
jgi:hypothetical protein